MNEELIISGRMNPYIDPHLEVWEWQIPLYLFLGGLAAGLLFFAAYFVMTGKEKKYPTTVKYGPIVAFIAIVIGLTALLLDLKHPLYFWQLYTTIRIDSPMSWGAWVLLIITFVSLIWIFSYLKEAFPKYNCKIGFISKLMGIFIEETGDGWEWKYPWLKTFEKYTQNNRYAWAWVLAVLSVILGVYTGILLSAFNARPLWNTAILGPLFLTSGFSTGAAMLMIMSKSHEERLSYSRIDLFLIIIELFFITHLFMGFLASSQVKVEAAHYFLGGEFTVTFWVNVIILGLVLPAILEAMELLKYKIPVIIPGLLILWGGVMFRFIMVEAGQIIRYLY
ncbi:MAG: polysulfide reductase NrfD [Bacteroidales bacterium]|nr:polysulfide reductase NrfD [Bacteroidales bacterium]